MEDRGNKKETYLNLINTSSNIYNKYIFQNNSNIKNINSTTKINDYSINNASKGILNQTNNFNVISNKNYRLDPYNNKNENNLSEKVTNSTQSTNLQINKNDLSVFNKNYMYNHNENLDSENSSIINNLFNYPESTKNINTNLDKNSTMNYNNHNNRIDSNTMYQNPGCNFFEKLTFNKNSSNNNYIKNSDNNNIIYKSPSNKNNLNNINSFSNSNTNQSNNNYNNKKYDFNLNLNLNLNSNSNSSTIKHQNISVLSPIEKQQSDPFMNNLDLKCNESNSLNKPNEPSFLYKYSELLNAKNSNLDINSNSRNPILNLNNNSENETFTCKEFQGKIKFIFRDNANYLSELSKKLQSQSNVIDEYENWLVLLLNILTQTRYNSQLRNVELVKFVI